jgi:nitrate reductase alpha subunit
MPFYPQFKQNTLDLCDQAVNEGASSDKEISNAILEKLKSREINYSVSDPEAPENHPRVWYIWRGNAIVGSMKGHEYALKHYLGTHSNGIAQDSADHTKEVKWHDVAPVGKMDLVVDLNFRMDSSALYSDIVLPAASWYEKADLNSTDLHSFIHPLSQAIAPVWESKTDWDIFKCLAKATSEMAKEYFSKPRKDIVTLPLAHDTADEISQPEIKDWYKDECEPIPGKTMHKLAVVDRDYTQIYEKFITLGDGIKTSGLGAHGNHYTCEGEYDEMVQSNHFPVRELDGEPFLR